MITMLHNASNLQRDIAKTLLYFGIFRHPLRLTEIHRFLPSDSVTIEDIQYACSTEPLSKHVVEANGLVSLDHEPLDFSAERRQKEQRARYMWFVAVLMSQIIRRFPYVRAVFVSGELSKGVASKNSDIDFFVVTAPNRVWITRTLFTLFKRIVLFNSKRMFCYNHITSEQNLRIENRTMYTAVEIATLKPIYNLALYREFMVANSWVKDYLPNSFSIEESPSRRESPKFLTERILDHFLSAHNLNKIDQWLLGRWRSLWFRRYHYLAPEKREKLFRCEADLSTAYVNDFLPRITQAYARRLHQFGLITIDVVEHEFSPEV